MDRLRKKRSGHTFTQISASTYPAIADRVRVVLKELVSDGRPAMECEFTPPMPILNMRTVGLMHLYNMEQVHPELKFGNLAARKIVAYVTLRIISWLDKKMHSHPSTGSTFSIE